MTHVHIVTEPERLSWILRPLSEALADALPDASIGEAPDPSADVNFYNNYGVYKPAPTITMALFTHYPERPPHIRLFKKAKKELDWCFSMCSITSQHLPADKTSILPTYPVNQDFYKDEDLMLGVVGRETGTGRKRLSWIEALEALPNVSVKHPNNIPAEAMPEYYDSIDYLVVTSRLEGGPMPVIEALARKKPVIAPDVGYCWDYPVIRYTTKKELLQIARDLTIPRDAWDLSAQILLNTYDYLTGATDELELEQSIRDPRVDARKGN